MDGSTSLDVWEEGVAEATAIFEEGLPEAILNGLLSVEGVLL